MRDLKIIRERVSNRILEKDFRKTMVTKMYRTQSQANDLHNLSDKHSIVLAQMIVNSRGWVYLKEDFDKSSIALFEKILKWIKLRSQNSNLEIPDYKDDLKYLEINEAEEYADSYLQAFKEITENLVIDKKNALVNYPNDWYWLDLKTNYSKFEEKWMGHCGSEPKADTLISLRDEKGLPHLTMAFNYDGTYLQLKGRKNSKPKVEYYEKIYDVFVKLEIQNYQKEYKPELDFHVRDWNEAGMRKEYEDYVKSYPLLKYDYIRPFQQGLAKVGLAKKVGLINLKFEEVVEPKYSYISDFQDRGLAIFTINKKSGFINKRGEIVIEPKYDVIVDDYGDLIRVVLDEKWGCINKKNEVVIEIKYDRIYNFKDGVAHAEINGENIFLNEKGEEFDKSGNLRNKSSKVFK